MRSQRTIKSPVTFEGIGLHTGRYARVTMYPGERDSGIVFFRKDRNTMIRANVNNVIDTAFATTIGVDGVRIKTVEHLLSAISGFGIDNLYIEITGPEIPVLDGSAYRFAELILKAGIVKQAKKMPYLKIVKPFIFEEGNVKIFATPFEGRKFTYYLELSHGSLRTEVFTINLTEENYLKEISMARTFGFLKDVEYMRKNGLALGGSLSNAVVIDGDKILNEDGLRYADEFVRHKILDMIGDLSLSVYPIMGHIISYRSGHSTNIKFLKRLLSSRSVILVDEESYTLDARSEKIIYFQ